MNNNPAVTPRILEMFAKADAGRLARLMSLALDQRRDEQVLEFPQYLPLDVRCAGEIVRFYEDCFRQARDEEMKGNEF